MGISLILTREILKLFMVLIMGYILIKTGLLRSDESKSISALLVYLITPCMIINSFQIEASTQVMKGLLYSFVMAVIVHLLFLALTAFLTRTFRLDLMEGLSIAYTSAGVLVIPLVEAILGQEYVVYSCGFIVVQLILLWTHCQRKISGGRGIQWKNILLNPNVLAILIGATLFATRVQLPSLLGETVGMVASMIGPMGMLLAGMIIADVPLREVFAVPRNYLATILRLIVYPLLLLVVFWLFHFAGYIPEGKNLLLIVYLASITPSCAMLVSMAQLYERNAQKATVLYVLTTILAVITMPVMIGIFSAVI